MTSVFPSRISFICFLSVIVCLVYVGGMYTWSMDGLSWSSSGLATDGDVIVVRLGWWR